LPTALGVDNRERSLCQIVDGVTSVILILVLLRQRYFPKYRRYRYLYFLVKYHDIDTDSLLSLLTIITDGWFVNIVGLFVLHKFSCFSDYLHGQATQNM